MNDCELGTQDPVFYEKLGQIICESKIWSQLGYITHLETAKAIELRLECQTTLSIANELGTARFNRLRQVEWNINYLTPSKALLISEFIEMLNYLMLSTYYALHILYPLVFSVSARYTVDLNYPFIKRNVLEVIKAPFTTIKEEDPESIIFNYISVLQKTAETELLIILAMREVNKKRLMSTQSKGTSPSTAIMDNLREELLEPWNLCTFRFIEPDSLKPRGSVSPSDSESQVQSLQPRGRGAHHKPLSKIGEDVNSAQ